ncbi:putative ATP/GTP-binding protein [Clostridium sp. CAG:798]|jgi:putative ATP/GTP-binding protein|nr:putative ATP/GTP-binding protein [Clostridium sp. CAG:798]
MDIKNIIFENYKCFRHAEISNLQPINIIIGKNNIGKSSILDILEMIYSKRSTRQTNIIADKELSEMDIRRVFREDMYGGLPGSNHFEFGKVFIGKNFKINIKNDGKYTSNEFYEQYNDIYKEQYKTYWKRLGTEIYY